MALDTVLGVFPQAKIIMTHRDPIATIPSYCSMESSLYKLGSETISNSMIGTYWFDRLDAWLDSFMEARAMADVSRFMDIDYRDMISDPVAVGQNVLDFCAIPLSREIEAGMSEWVEANRREHRAAHKYSLEDFSLTEEGIRSHYKKYIRKFVSAK